MKSWQSFVLPCIGSSFLTLQGVLCSPAQVGGRSGGERSLGDNTRVLG